MLEGKNIAKNVLEFLRLADGEHYEYLAALCKADTPILLGQQPPIPLPETNMS
jgi:hypothetical protein